MKEGKHFFFARKKQKTLTPCRALTGERTDREQKFFASFLQKRSACLLLLLATSPAQAAGFMQATVPDGKNPPIQIGIWYPSAADTQPQALALDTQIVAVDGPITGGPLPLVVMSHGQGGGFGNHYDTAIALANAGFVAAALTHTGDNYRDQSRVLMIWDRSRQLRVVTDWMLHTWPAHALINADEIGVFGFSAGGFTALVAAGGTPDLARIGPYCATHKTEFTCALITRNQNGSSKPPIVPAGAWVHDPRIKAAVVAAPALGYTFGRTGLAGVTVPVQLWRAEDDHVLPQPSYAQAVRDDLPKLPDYHVVPKADHMDFLPPCDAHKTTILPPICHSPAGFDRAAFHTMFDGAVVAFFKKTLRSGG